MSILIKGMKLPKSCRTCRFSGYGGRSFELNVCMFTGESQPTLSPERMSGCPLIPVPPHGDLIDRERIKKAFEKACDECKETCEEFDGFYADCNQCLMHGVIEELLAMPTVIEAEETDA